MSEQKKISTMLITNISLVLGVIFWSGFSYSNIKDNTQEVIEVKEDLKTLTEKYHQDILYVRENMITKKYLIEMQKFLNKSK